MYTSAREAESAYYDACLAFLRLYLDDAVAERFRRDPAGLRNRNRARARARSALEGAQTVWQERAPTDTPHLVEDDGKRAIDAMLAFASTVLGLLMVYRGRNDGPMDANTVSHLETAGVVAPLKALAVRGNANEQKRAARTLWSMSSNGIPGEYVDYATLDPLQSHASMEQKAAKQAAKQAAEKAEAGRKNAARIARQKEKQAEADRRAVAEAAAEAERKASERRGVERKEATLADLRRRVATAAEEVNRMAAEYIARNGQGRTAMRLDQAKESLRIAKANLSAQTRFG